MWVECSLHRILITDCCRIVLASPGFPRLVENPGIIIGKFPGPGKSWKMTLVLESPGNYLQDPGKS